MPSLPKPRASSPPSGPPESDFPTKSQTLLMRYQPGLPEFPLSEEAIESVADRPGELPRNLDHWSVLLRVDGSRQRRGK